MTIKGLAILKSLSRQTSSARNTEMVAYPQEIEPRMRQFFESLSEKDRRRYAGIEALK